MRIVYFLIILAITIPAQGRKWTDLTGTYSVEAEFVNVVGDQVILRKKDGQQLKLLLSQLSKIDQDYVRAQAKGKLVKQSLAQAMQANSKLEFTQTPLHDVVASLQSVHNLPVYLDAPSLDEFGVSADTPVTFKSNGQTLGQSLDAIGKPIKLTWLIAYDVVYITTQEKAGMMLETRIYQLKDPMSAGQVQNRIMRQIKPESWERLAGPGATIAHGKHLIVSQYRTVHEEISQLKQDLIPIAQPLLKTKATTFSKALEQRTALTFRDAPLRSVLKTLEEQTQKAGFQGKYRIDIKAFDEIGLLDSTPVTVNIKGLPLRSYLALVLDQLSLTFVQEGNDILVTTLEAAEAKLITTSYDVSGIVLQPGTADNLIRVVTQIIAPDSWEEVGGAGSITFVAPAHLKISQVREVHEKIARLLNTLQTLK